MENVEVLAYNLRRIRKAAKYTQEDFAKKIGVQRTTYATYEKKIRAPQDVLEAIHKEFKVAYAEFSKPLPEGMKLNESGKLVPQESATPYNQGKGDAQVLNDNEFHVMWTPVVTERAYAGYTRGFSDPEFIDDLPKKPWIVDRQYKGEYRTFVVTGDSMDDGSSEALCDGDFVLGRRLTKDYWKNKLHIDEWDFIIVHETDGIIIKKIAEHNVEKQTLKLHSRNTDLYPDFIIKLSDVKELFNVVRWDRAKK